MRSRSRASDAEAGEEASASLVQMCSTPARNLAKGLPCWVNLYRSRRLRLDGLIDATPPSRQVHRRSPAIEIEMFQVPWERIEWWPKDVSLLKEAGYVLAGMTLGGAIMLDELVAEDHENLALVFAPRGRG